VLEGHAKTLIWPQGFKLEDIMADEQENIVVEGEENDEGNNPLENFEDFVNEGEKPEETAEETTEEAVTEEEPEQQEKVKVPAKPIDKLPASEKEEHAWGKVKKENTILKAENAKLLSGFEALEARLASLENTESTRGLETKKAQYKQSYIDMEISEAVAERMAERDIRLDKLEAERTAEKKQPEKSKADIRTQTEQSMLYRMNKSQKAKAELPVSQQTNTVRMTAEQKRVYDMAKKTSWGKDMKASEFIKSYSEL
jgi:hypothetical protein